MNSIVIKASELDFDSMVRLLMENELGILLIEADKPGILDFVMQNITYKDQMGIYGNGCRITCCLYPIYYKNQINEGPELKNIRIGAAQAVFRRWTAAGYNEHRAKSIFASDSFWEYLDESGLTNADYMLLMVQ